MYNIKFDIDFDKSYQKLIKGNKILEKKFLKTITNLSINPKINSLKTHKVDIIDNEQVWVSYVSGDIRLAWIFDKDQKLVIICLKLGKYSGSSQIYRIKSS